MREILTRWTTPAGGDNLTVMYFDETTPVAAQRAALGNLWRDVDSVLSGNVTWTVATDGRLVEPATGGLTGFWAEPTAQTAPGAVVGQPVPDAAQVLLRWRTGVVIARRRVQGRSFVPGLVTSQLSNGNVQATAVTALAAAAQAFTAAGVGFGIWTRPRPPLGGSFTPATTGTAWAEMATQRRRRG